LVGTDVLPLIFEPALNFIHGAQDTTEFIRVEVGLGKTVASLADRLLETRLQTVEEVTELSICLARTIFRLAEKDRGINV